MGLRGPTPNAVDEDPRMQKLRAEGRAQAFRRHESQESREMQLASDVSEACCCRSDMILL